jgi:hypothetical protein
MTEALQWIQTNWLLVTFVAYVILSVANKLTKYYNENEGVKKVLGLVIELASFVTSKEVKDQIFKLPLTKKAPEVKPNAK